MDIVNVHQAKLNSLSCSSVLPQGKKLLLAKTGRQWQNSFLYVERLDVQVASKERFVSLRILMHPCQKSWPLPFEESVRDAIAVGHTCFSLVAE